MYLAVYGTLRRGGPANGLLRGGKWLGLDRVPGILYDVGPFPALRPNKKGYESNTVLVDVYEVDEGILPAIDKYEGHYPEALGQSLFVRREVLTKEGTLPVTVYEYRFDPVACIVESGDWFDVRRLLDD